MRRGRRPGTNQTRDELITAARRRFAESGYDQASVRLIASDVGVDPSMVMHFFGSKEELFRAVIAWPFDPDELVRAVVGPGPDGIGERFARTFFALWEDQATQQSLLAVFKSAVTHEASATLVREFLHDQLYHRLTVALGGDDLRVDLAISQLLGIAVLRHVLKIEPLASASVEEVVAKIAPTLDLYLI